MQKSLSQESLSVIKSLLESKLNEYRFVPCANNDECTKKYQLALEELESLKPNIGVNIKIYGKSYWMCKCFKYGRIHEIDKDYCEECSTCRPEYVPKSDFQY